MSYTQSISAQAFVKLNPVQRRDLVRERKLGWDEEIPCKIKFEWLQFVQQLEHMSKIIIPRYVLTPATKKITLMGFCDASERGYAAAIYLLNEDDIDKKTNLIMAKSKVAPLKTQSIPRLELCGALLLCRLIKHIQHQNSELAQCNHIVTFTDSLTVLSWLRTPTYLLKSFVASRVVQILDIIEPSCWRYVPSEKNPADCASRGCNPEEIVNNKLWWSGPAFLREPSKAWPACRHDLPMKKVPDLRLRLLESQVLVQVVDATILERFSSYTKLNHVTAWCLRFKNNAQVPDEQRVTGPLSTNELNLAILTLTKLVQK